MEAAISESPGHRPSPYAMAIDAVTEHTPRHVRHALHGHLGRWGCQAATDAVLLVATELLTNIWRHAPGSGALTPELNGDVIRLAVKDGSPRVPVIPQAPPDFNSPRGRGLWLVAEICDSFRFEAITDGTGPGKWAVVELARGHG